MKTRRNGGDGSVRPARVRRTVGKNSRFDGIERPYSQQDVERLRGSVLVEHTLARRGAEKLWDLLQSEDYVAALGAMTGNQAMQQVRAGLKAIYLSGWQVAADANLAGHMYPDQSLYPSNSVPQVVKRINQALQRADQIDYSEGKNDTHWFAPIVADAEAGFGGCLNAFELMKMMIEAGAAAVHFEDQLASEKKCGHLGGKVLVPTAAFIRTLTAARRAAEEVHKVYPGKMLAYNCSPSFNWAKKLDAETIAAFQRELAAMGYKFQFVTLAGFHALNYSMYELARQFKEEGMPAYSRLQQSEFAAESNGYTATKHQHEVGTGYFDEVVKVITSGQASTTALEGSTE